MKKLGLVLLVALCVTVMLPTMKAEASIVMDGYTTFTHLKFDALVYWRVYSPADNLSPYFSKTDYVYLYQIHNAGHTGDKAITQFGVDNPNQVAITTAGYLTGWDLDGLSGAFAPLNPPSWGGDNSALWTFQPGIALGKDSYLLYFTTPYAPIKVNGGVQAGSYNSEGPVPGPGPTVPEPVTLALLGMGLVGFVGRVTIKKFMA